MSECLFQYGSVEDVFYLSHVRQDGPVSMARNHFHSSYEIYYLISGQRYYFIKDKTFQVMGNDLILINKGDLHKTASCGESEHERLLINFKEEFLSPTIDTHEILLAPFKKDVNLIRFTMQQQREVEHLLNKIQNELVQKRPAYMTYVQALFMQFLIYIARHVLDQEQSDTFRHPSLMHKKVSKIVRHINAHYMDPLTLNNVAQKFNISPSYLSRIFKQATGFTFVEYINNVRIREAQSLLISTDEKVIDISYRVGYMSISHFGRVFKEMTGYSPLEFRKRNRERSTSNSN